MAKSNIDEIGPWSQIKHDIIEKYAAAYSVVVAGSKSIKRHIYIDAFSGPGLARSKETGKIVAGSPLRVLAVEPPFSEYHFIDLDGEKTNALSSYTQQRANVTVHTGDCNEVLLNKVFPLCRFEDFHRAL